MQLSNSPACRQLGQYQHWSFSNYAWYSCPVRAAHMYAAIKEKWRGSTFLVIHCAPFGGRKLARNFLTTLQLLWNANSRYIFTLCMQRDERQKMHAMDAPCQRCQVPSAGASAPRSGAKSNCPRLCQHTGTAAKAQTENQSSTH